LKYIRCKISWFISWRY